MSASSKLTYAQSSDIKSRTWLAYRYDMKRKAIAELEFLPFLQDLLQERYQDSALTVRKAGGDAQVWFGRSAAQVTQEPDYNCVLSSGETRQFEFQYAQSLEKLKFVDFKVSKVGKKKPRQPRVAHEDREFFYIVQSSCYYALLPCQWIMWHGEERGVPAWGNRTAYRVPVDDFLDQCHDGGQALAEVVARVESKNSLLAFQHEFLAMQDASFARELQRVVDEDALVKIVPGTLEGFYRVCHLLDKLDRSPDAPGVWLVYLTSFYDAAMSSLDFACWVYCLDFLNFRCERLSDNEKRVLLGAMQSARGYLRRQFANETQYIDELNTPAIEVIRQLLFATNLYEDLVQDCAATWGLELRPIQFIYETVPDVDLMHSYIERAQQPG